MLLGALCASGHPDAVSEQAGDMLGLLALGLGPKASTKLDARTYAGRPSGGEADMCMALWWRCSALQALARFIATVVQGGLVANTQQLVRSLLCLCLCLCLCVSYLCLCLCVCVCVWRCRAEVVEGGNGGR